MKTRLTDLLGIEHPLIQAPMAGVSTPAMAAAVSEAGGLGSVALGALSPEAARAALMEASAAGPGPIAANFFVHPAPNFDPAVEAQYLAEIAGEFEAAGGAAPSALAEIYRSFNDDDEMLEMVLDVRPAAVSLHFGAATPERMGALRDAGILVLATATSVKEAQALAATNVDVLVMQGYGAGGHSGAFLSAPDPATGGRSGLLALIRDTVAEVDVPVVAAGGLMTGSDVREVIAAGAAGAQLGTAFVACRESSASERYRELLVSGLPTRLTAGISGRAARGLENPLMAWAEGVVSPIPDYPLCYDAVKQLIAARQEPDFSVMWAGEGAAAARSLSAGDLLATIAAEMG